MKIIPLVENYSTNKRLKSKHGLSFYIETLGQKILFDIGSDKLFIENAKKLNINLSDVDILIISHGHVDHGGALSHFLNVNKKAKIYIKSEAFKEHYLKIPYTFIKINIGLDMEHQSNSRFIFTDLEYEIMPGIKLYSKVHGKELFSTSNENLLMREDGKFFQDNFEHEQYLLIKEHNKSVLFTGCSHRGILNIMRSIGNKFNIVVGGFHLYDPVFRKYENDELITKLAHRLKELNTDFYTCHCTGKKAFEKMYKILREKLKYLSVGDQIIF